MKTIIIALMLMPLALAAQTDSLHVYAEIYPGTTVVNRMTVFASYGSMLPGHESGIIKSDAGQRIMFHSMTDAMTYMAAQGWEYVGNYSTGSGAGSKNHFIIRKKVHVSQTKKPESE